MNKIVTATAFSPSHITGLFQIFEKGSTGAGLNTDQGARTTVSLIESSIPTICIKINGLEVSDASVSKEVISSYSDFITSHSVHVDHEIMAPIGYGLGMSGAGAYSLSLALNKVTGFPYSETEVMEIAKFAEIKSGTGLGDVVAQQFPGIMMGEKPYPSTTIRLIDHDNSSVVCGFFAPIDTKSIIRNSSWKDTINRIGGECMERLEKDPSLKNFIEQSRYFSLETKLASDQIKKVMLEIPNASMAMLGQTVFVVTNQAESTVAMLEKYTNRVSVSKISDRGAHVIN